jgi:pimeloyl-ACP methyl ester carboxylesterase
VAGQGQPLVVVPGLAGGLDLLDPLIAELSRSFTVYAYQLRGEEFGIFDRAYDLGRLADDLASVIRGLGLERPGLLGVSFGGAIALELASRNSVPLSFLSLQGSADRFDGGLFGAVARRVLGGMPLPPDNPFVNQFFHLLVGSRGLPEERFNFLVDRCWRTDQSVMSHRLELLGGFDRSALRERIKVPTLAVGTENDVIVPAKQVREMARQLPTAVYRELRSAGHFAFVTHPGDVANSVRRFAGRVLAN